MHALSERAAQVSARNRKNGSIGQEKRDFWSDSIDRVTSKS
jgi:hypothetical protein